MKLKITLSAATAVGLIISTAAYADGNKAYISQDGLQNQASITQASGATTGNQAGTSTDNMSQNGSKNILTITQNGDAGKIGVKTGTDNYFTPDYPYSGGTPQFSITYKGVDQTSSGSGSNTATLTQSGTGSVVGELQQNAASSAHGNTATVNQTGANTINHIWQTQDASTSVANIIDATETGSGNVIDRIDQRGSGTDTNRANRITVDISGDNNGAINLHGHGSFYSSRAWAAGATQSALIQNDYGSQTPPTLRWDPAVTLGEVGGNVINLTISGSSNQYGMTQKGTKNTTGNVLISGSSNFFGSYQAGQGNTIGAGEIAGGSNDVGIYQSGYTNDASVSTLAGGSGSNGVLIAQRGTSNSAAVNITGSFNGNHSFGGPAATLVSNSGGLLSNGLVLQGSATPGDISEGSNTANINIFGDNNAFAVASLGSDNLVTGNVGSAGHDSNSNSAAVLQNGSSNVASFSQAGTGSNSVSISQ